LIASAKMNAAVAVRKSSPTKTAVFLVDVDIFDVVAVDISDLLVVCNRSQRRDRRRPEAG
jgi:hypothetical protein